MFDHQTTTFGFTVGALHCERHSGASQRFEVLLPHEEVLGAYPTWNSIK